MKEINNSESLYKIEMSQYSNLDFIRAEFPPFFDLWQTSASFWSDQEEWQQASMFKLHFAEIQKKVQDEYLKKTIQLIKRFEEKEPREEQSLNVALELKQDISKFRSSMWLIEMLTTEAMKNFKKSKPHWEEIFRRVLEPPEDGEEGISPQKQSPRKQHAQGGLPAAEEGEQQQAGEEQGAPKLEGEDKNKDNQANKIEPTEDVTLTKLMGN